MYTQSTRSFLTRIIFLCWVAVLVLPKESAAAAANVRQSAHRTRIVQGKPIPIKDAAYTVQVTDTFGLHLCGGSLISDQFVVTAGHCLHGRFAYTLKVIAGTIFRGNLTNGTTVNVTEMYIHPEYLEAFKPVNLHMDVAVLKLEKPMAFSDTIQPIKMCNSPVEATQLIRILGWGNTEYEGSKSDILLSIDVPVKSQYECIKMHEDSLTKITRSMVCAGQLGGKDSCGGDSGGPAVRMGELCGIVSWGIGCGDKKHVGIYTSIPVVRSFIDKCMRGQIKPIRSRTGK